MDKKQIEIIAQSQLFCGIEQKYIAELLKRTDIYVTDFSKGDVIFPIKTGYGLCILLSGSAECYNGQTLLNRYTAGDSFGAASLFCEEDYPTVVKARQSGSAIYISRTAAEHLISICPDFGVKYLTLLSQKIHLLNRKIDSFTANNSYQKVLKYLQSSAKESGEVKLNLSLSRLASALDMGRASLYRALDCLESEGKIKRDGRFIELTDANKNKKGSNENENT